MAKKFGGKFSPDGTTQDGIREAVVDQRKVNAAGAKANLLFVPGVLLAFLSLNEGATGLLMGLGGAALMSLAAWLTRDGMRAAAAYDLRKVARKPAIPRKIIGSVLTGLGVALASLMNDPSMLAAILYGVAAGGLHTMAFGIDPLRDKRMEGIDTFQQDRVAKVVDEAEANLASMTDHIGSIGDRHLEARTAQFQATARKMIRTVEEDPRDLTGARKFLGVYLMGARDAAAKFADLYKRQRDETARADFESLLSDLEQNFAARTEKLLLDDRSDMDIEIKVLRDRLQREGL
ncbi:5-bromo-4-chloroindolyl phosphate hydrolysis family protein [Octadecabacter sp. 1_MG-2023]|uniref:5-bromo-4-chloroindolyl phosphate hydrolysis family protein n=1 Tax=unclassified Octadecabacter TaxID=196158 RepID=UPI001C0A5E60|nr:MULTISPECIES: 5-bromo-4-chloroindolyl phosphate hydrolysis family protein [unclassified Octadecabacter]MBU2992705.1 5-bromo-4-chloroindolyl phosphate hydrolysis family protein [Octadecabacter sp. B2R22]MDO6733844.1 5-bromo-4-chloroindolyl phosphate hydrolysis family protein [Octadecabacter sp. 1_MG-2023]